MYKCGPDQISTWTSQLTREDGLWRRIYTNSDEIGSATNETIVKPNNIDNKIDELKKDMAELRDQYTHYRQQTVNVIKSGAMHVLPDFSSETYPRFSVY